MDKDSVESTTVTISSGGESVTMTAKELEDLATDNFPYPLPKDESQLFPGNATLAAAPDLTIVANRLVNVCDEHGALRDYKLRVLWKSGTPKWLGKAKVKSEEDRLLSGVDLLILVAWENCRLWKITAKQMEALLYHEICHFEVDYDKDGNPKLTARDHDIEEFNAVIAKYGDWRKQVSELGKQLEMFLGGEEADQT